MEPTNDNQRAIAAIIDRLSTENSLTPSSIAQVVNALNFLMTWSDSEFLAAYIRWRTDNPIREGGQRHSGEKRQVTADE